MTRVAADDLRRAQARTWATVDLDAISHNVRAIRGRLSSTTAFMAVVKADGYGHGAVPVAQAALEAGASWLGVATVEEALELRAAGLRAPLLILGPVPEAWSRAAIEADCALTVGDVPFIEVAHRLAGRARPRFHIKVDTGMTRLGIAPEAVEAVLDAMDPRRVTVEGVFTHLACADEPEPNMTREQLAAFDAAARMVRARWPGALRHAAGSAAALAYPESAFEMVRIGIALYGVPPAPHLGDPPLRPAMTLISRAVRVRRVRADTPVSYGATYRSPAATTVATIPVGYADGYPRSLSNTGQMLIGDRRFPVAGRVCMDYTMLDVGEASLREGDAVTVFGPGLPVEEVAAAAGTIAYEVLCRVGRRVPRIYLREGRPIAAPHDTSVRVASVTPDAKVRR